jgi:hypothetical protein
LFAFVLKGCHFSGGAAGDFLPWDAKTAKARLNLVCSFKFESRLKITMAFDAMDGEPPPPPPAAYLRELSAMFPHVDPSAIDLAIARFGAWGRIVEHLQGGPSPSPPRPVAQSLDPKLSLPPRAFAPPPHARLGICTAPTQPPGDCRLYLPASLIGVDMDLERFGDFGAVVRDARFDAPYGGYGRQVARPPGPRQSYFSQTRQRGISSG